MLCAFLNQKAAFLELQIDRQTTGMLLFEFLGEIPELVFPREHRKYVTTKAGERKAAAPPVVAEGRHCHLAPLRIVFGPPEQRRSKPVMSVRYQVGGNLNQFTDKALCRKASVIDGRADRIDRNPGRGCGRGHVEWECANWCGRDRRQNSNLPRSEH